MATLPTNRSQADTAEAHVDDHNEVHRLHNLLDDAAGTKGDILVHNGSTWVKLPVGGTNGYVLMVDSAQSAGVKWAAEQGGGGGSGGLDHFFRSYAVQGASFNVSEQGYYVVDTSGGDVTAVLPFVSAVPSTGMVCKFKRLGANELYVSTQGSDHFDLGGIVTKVLFVDDAALHISAMPAVANTWMEWGYYGNVMDD